MASILVMRALVGASLSIGVADVAVIDLVAAPRALDHAPAIPVAIAALAPVAAPVVAATPPPPAAIAEPAKHHEELPPVVAAAAPPPPAAIAPREDHDHLYFAKLRADLDDDARHQLAAIAQRHPTAIAIEGHTDYRGGEALNLPLRRGRADATRAELVRLGVATAAITVAVAAPSEPATAASDAELSRDRRVDLTLTFTPSQGDPPR